MKEFENIPEEFFDLLETKDFAALSKEEKELVLEKISEQEYNEFFQMLADFKSLDQEIETEAPDFEILKEAKVAKKKDRSIYYKVAVAAAFLLFTGLRIWDYKSEVHPPVEIAVADTLSDSNPESRIDERWLAGRLEILKESTKSVEQNKGVSLLQEDYPEEFVLDFGSATIPRASLRTRF